LYNEIVIKHFQNPKGVGRIEDADLIGKAGLRGQGYWLIVYIKLDGDRVVDAGFETYGCPAVIASGSMLVETIQGKSVNELYGVTDTVILERLGGLPIEKQHGPRIAAAALRDAIRMWQTI